MSNNKNNNKKPKWTNKKKHKKGNNKSTNTKATKAAANDTALQKGVLSRYELHDIKTLYKAYPYQLTDEVVIDAIFYGSRGVLTFLATKYKNKLLSSSSSSTNKKSWNAFVKRIPNQSLSRRDKTLTTICRFSDEPVTYRSLDFLSSIQLEEYLNVFPELMLHPQQYSEEGGFSLSGLDHCFSHDHFTGDKLKALINTNATTVFREEEDDDNNIPKRFCLRPDLDYSLGANRDVMDTDCTEALSLIMTKINYLHISWSDWTKEAFDMFLRSLFDDKTTCKRLAWDEIMEPEFAPSIVKDIAGSLSEKQMWACPIEEVFIEKLYGFEEVVYQYPIVSLLPSMRNLKKLKIIAASHDMEWSILAEVVARGNLVSLYSETYSEDINNIGPFPVDSIISVLEATRNSQSLKEIIIAYAKKHHREKACLENPLAAEAIGACLCNILKRDNTTLTDVLIDPVREGNLYWEKVKYYCHFNQLGRKKIQEQRWTLAYLVDLLAEVKYGCCMYSDGSKHLTESQKQRMETSMVFDILSEQPGLWSENTFSSSTLGIVPKEFPCRRKDNYYCCNVCGCNARYYCPGCGAIDYCSVNCQTGDWKDHRKSCPQAGAQNCNYCQKKTYGKCSRCSVIPYCGKSCERKDRWIHRFGCQMEQFD